MKEEMLSMIPAEEYNRLLTIKRIKELKTEIKENSVLLRTLKSRRKKVLANTQETKDLISDIYKRFTSFQYTSTTEATLSQYIHLLRYETRAKLVVYNILRGKDYSQQELNARKRFSWELKDFLKFYGVKYV